MVTLPSICYLVRYMVSGVLVTLPTTCYLDVFSRIAKLLLSLLLFSPLQPYLFEGLRRKAKDIQSRELMNASEVANRFNARREGKTWRAKCPVHRSKGSTLAIYSNADHVGLHCFAGCSKDDILATVGLSWKDLLFDDKRLSPEEKRAWSKQKYINRIYAAEERSQALKLWLTSLECKQKPVRTQSSFERDIERFCNSLEAR